MVQVAVPEEYNEQEVEVQVILTTKEADKSTEQPTKKGGLGHLVGSLSHLSDEEKEKIDRDNQELRDSWEKDIL